MAKMGRLNQRVKELASRVISRNLNDPRIKNVTVMEAEFSIDLRYCTIKISVLGTKSQVRTAMRGLQHARGFIQRQIASSLQLRYAPIITIELNEGIKKQQNMSSFIDQVRKEDQENYNFPEDGESENEDSDGEVDSGNQDGVDDIEK